MMYSCPSIIQPVSDRNGVELPKMLDYEKWLFCNVFDQDGL